MPADLHAVGQDEVIISFFNDEIADPSLPRPVTAVRAVRDAVTGVGKGSAFVERQTKAAAQVALTLNGQKLEGRPLRVTRISSSLPGHSEGPVRTAKRAAGHSAPLSTSSVSGVAHAPLKRVAVCWADLPG